MNPYHMIEPCCIAQQLPPLLLADGVHTFSTNGDVTAEQFLQNILPAVGYAAHMTLHIPALTVPLLQLLRHCKRRGWVGATTIVTAEPQADLVKTWLTDYVYQYGTHRLVGTPMLILRPNDSFKAAKALPVIVLAGDLNDCPTDRRTTYSLICSTRPEHYEHLTLAADALSRSALHQRTRTKAVNVAHAEPNK